MFVYADVVNVARRPFCIDPDNLFCFVLCSGDGRSAEQEFALEECSEKAGCSVEKCIQEGRGEEEQRASVCIQEAGAQPIAGKEA